MFLALHYFYDYDDGYSLVEVQKYDNCEEALEYKRTTEEADSDHCIEVYEANRID